MWRYILKKIFYGILVLLGVVTVVFFLFTYKSSEGSVARSIAGNSADKEMIAEIEHEFGLDLPLYEQYLLYLNDLSPISFHSSTEEDHSYLDTAKYDYSEIAALGSGSLVFKKPYLRTSYVNQKEVAEILWEYMPSTIILALTAIVLATFLGIIMGIVAAVNRGTYIDNTLNVFAVLGMSGPSYFVAILFASIGAYAWHEVTYIPALPFICLAIGAVIGLALNKMKSKHLLKKFSWSFFFEMVLKGFLLGLGVWLLLFSLAGLDISFGLHDMYLELPGTGLNVQGKLYEIDDYGDEIMTPKNIILPALTLGIRPLAIVLQLTRSSLIETLSSDYIRTAKSKGLSMYKVVTKHALKNALIPVVTAISGWFASLLAGAIFVEFIFNWDGIGLYVFKAVMANDVPLVMGAVLLIASFFVIINILVDILYGFLDPRIRLK